MGYMGYYWEIPITAWLMRGGRPGISSRHVSWVAWKMDAAMGWHNLARAGLSLMAQHILYICITVENIIFLLVIIATCYLLSLDIISH